MNLDKEGKIPRNTYSPPLKVPKLRRRIKAEEKAKVVAAILGGRIYSISSHKYTTILMQI